MTTVEELIARVDAVLDSVLASPLGWGGAPALEPVVLALLAVRSLGNTEVGRDAYLAFLLRRLGGPGSMCLADRCKGDLDLMVQVLREYVEIVREAAIAGEMKVLGASVDHRHGPYDSVYERVRAGLGLKSGADDGDSRGQE